MKLSLRMFMVLLAVLMVGAFSPQSSVEAQEGTALLRVVHASPDAPAVDIYLNGEAALLDIPFFTATGYIELPAGTYAVAIAPAGTSLNDAVLSADVSLMAGMAYTAAAAGALADLQLLAFEDDLSPTADGEARVAVYHLSPDAPAVDVKLADGTPLLTNLPFGSVGTLNVPAATYDLIVTPTGSDAVVLDLAGTMLEAGNRYSVFATDFVSNLTAQLAVTALTQEAAAPDEPMPEEPMPEPTAVPMPEEPAVPALPASVRVVHASPDAPAVDVYVNGNLTLSNVPFFTVSDYLEIPAGTYRIQVTPTGSAPDAAVIDADVEVLPGRAYTIAATGFVANIGASIFEDNLSPTNDARLTVYHVAPDAGSVDVKLADGTSLVRGLDFLEFATLEVPPSTYSVNVTPAGSDAILTGLTDATLESGVFYGVFAFLTPGALALDVVPVRVSEGIAAQPDPTPPPVATPIPAPAPTPVPPVRLPDTATGSTLPMGGLVATALLLMVAGGAALAVRRRR